MPDPDGMAEFLARQKAFWAASQSLRSSPNGFQLNSLQSQT
jgi:hypothetical protein